MIPKYFVQQVKDAIRISELVGKFVALKRNGREFGGLCPFHQEKTPSFTVSDEKGFYHCFGCQAHGDAVGFMMQHERMNYVDAVKYLADMAGMQVPEESDEARREEERREKLLRVLEAAALFYENMLKSNAGFEAREYVKRRGLGTDTLAHFRIGYAPGQRDALKRELLGKGFDEQLMVDAGLLVKPDEGESYDKFRDRLMFPILHKHGQVVAFGGRLLANNPDSKAPKYLNSPETAVFKKRDMLYNLQEALIAARVSSRLVVVEGYMDVIACYQAGVDDAVATLGTAFTQEHLQTLWRQVDEPVICLDGDSAGSRAMMRSAEIALPMVQPGKSLKFAVLPKGDDPDSLIKRAGRQAFEEVMRQAIGLHEALFKGESHGLDIRDPNQRAALEKKLDQLAGQIQDSHVRQHYRNYFRESLWNLSKRPQTTGNRQATKQDRSQRSIAAPGSPSDRLSRTILKLLLLVPELMNEAQAETALAQMACHQPSLEQLRECLLDMAHHHEGQGTLEDALKQRQLWDTATTLLSDQGLIISKTVREALDEAKLFLSQLVTQMDMLALETEYQRISKELSAESVSENDLARLMALQEEIRLRKKPA